MQLVVVYQKQIFNILSVTHYSKMALSINPSTQNTNRSQGITEITNFNQTSARANLIRQNFEMGYMKPLEFNNDEIITVLDYEQVLPPRKRGATSSPYSKSTSKLNSKILSKRQMKVKGFHVPQQSKSWSQLERVEPKGILVTKRLYGKKERNVRFSLPNEKAFQFGI
ncbi:hypothetical protein pb186bvf_001503 [Paramecium bursaria]